MKKITKVPDSNCIPPRSGTVLQSLTMLSRPRLIDVDPEQCISETKAKLNKAWVEANNFWAEADTLYVEGNELWESAVRRVCGEDATIELVAGGCVVMGIMEFNYTKEMQT